MFAKTYAANAGGSSSAAADVQTELTALTADTRGLAKSNQQLAGEAPGLARERLGIRSAATQSGPSLLQRVLALLCL